MQYQVKQQLRYAAGMPILQLAAVLLTAAAVSSSSHANNTRNTWCDKAVAAAAT
jgi:hypothetical protein